MTSLVGWTTYYRYVLWPMFTPEGFIHISVSRKRPNKRTATTVVSSPANSWRRFLAEKKNSASHRPTCRISAGRWSGKSHTTSLGRSHNPRLPPGTLSSFSYSCLLLCIFWVFLFRLTHALALRIWLCTLFLLTYRILSRNGFAVSAFGAAQFPHLSPNLARAVVLRDRVKNIISETTIRR